VIKGKEENVESCIIAPGTDRVEIRCELETFRICRSEKREEEKEKLHFFSGPQAASNWLSTSLSMYKCGGP